MAVQVREVGALVMVVVALGVVAYLAFKGNQAALGALISILAAGVGYFLRGKITASTP